MKTAYINSFINDHGEVNGPVIIGDYIGREDFDYTKFSNLLNEMLVESYPPTNPPTRHRIKNMVK